MKLLLAIDPGPRQSACVELDAALTLRRHDILSNRELLLAMGYTTATHCVIEQVESYGMRVGRDVFETVFWSGRFCERWVALGPFSSSTCEADRIPRTAVKLHICGSRRARDSDIRQALIDRYGGSRREAVGTKKAPGPLYGVRLDIWQALALGITWWETRASRDYLDMPAYLRRGTD